MSNPAGHFRFGPDSGHLVVRTRREGLAAKVGHDLTIDVTRWSADVDSGGDDPAQTRITVRVELDSFVVREGTGGALPLTAADRTEINTTMSRLLTTGGSSMATFVSTAVTASGKGGTVDGTLSLHGANRPVRLTVSADGPDRYRGSTTVSQSAHRIKPYSAFFGALRLRDEVAVEFDVDLTAAQAGGE